MYRIRLGCAAYARMNIAPGQARRMMYIEGVMMYRIRLGCAAYARMNIAPDQARRMMYIGGKRYEIVKCYSGHHLLSLSTYLNNIMYAFSITL
jgi:hypothetical protein